MSYIPALPNGVASASNATPGTLPIQNIAGVSRSAPALNYEFLTNSTNGWFDALGYTWVSFTTTTTSVTSGIIVFECTNDVINTSSGTYLHMQETTTLTTSNAPRVGTASFSGSSTRQFEAPVTARYLRARVQTAFSGGTISLAATLRQAAPPTNFSYVSVNGSLPTGSNTLGTATLGTGSATVGGVNFAADIVTDVSATLTTSLIPSVIDLGVNAHGNSFCVNVSAASGTSPTLDVIIQESGDNVNFTDIFHFDRITAVSQSFTPTLRVQGQYIRYRILVAGTSPSFTLTVLRSPKPVPGLLLRSFFDRTIDLTTINSVSASYYVAGCTFAKIIIAASGTSNPVVQLQGSPDNSAWFTLGSSFTVTAGIISPFFSSFYNAKWIRLIVQTNNSRTLMYANFITIGPS